MFDLKFTEKTDRIIKMGDFFVCDAILLITEGEKRRVAFIIVDDKDPFGYELVESVVSNLFTKNAARVANRDIITQMKNLYTDRTEEAKRKEAAASATERAESGGKQRLKDVAQLAHSQSKSMKNVDAITSITELLQPEIGSTANNRVFAYNVQQLVATNAHMRNAVIDMKLEQIAKQIHDTLEDFFPMYSYLQLSKREVGRDNGMHFIFVIGNESCDLDSAMSAIAMADFLNGLTREELKKYLLAGTELPANVMVVPLLHIKNIHRKLKTESKYYLKKIRLSIDIVPTLYVFVYYI